MGAAPLAAAPVVAATAPNCKVENEILVTKSCVPTAENVCTKELVDTEEIEYEKVCKDVVDTICDAAPAAAIAHIAKREAEAEAEAVADADADADAAVLYGGLGGIPAPYGAGHIAHAAVAPVAHAAVAPVAHAVAHSAVTTVSCSDIENALPKTTCEPVETTHVAGYAVPG